MFDLATFDQLQGIARQVDESDFVRADPPPGLWDRIATQIATPIHVKSTRQRRAVWLVGAAAAMVAIVGGAAALRDGGGDSQLLATSVLTNKGLSERGARSSGEAMLRRVDEGLVLHVEVDDAPDTAASYLELWLIDRNVQGMVSLGPFHGSGDYPVPDGIDPDIFPIVDLSLEPTDGIPTHSGESIVRGVMK